MAGFKVTLNLNAIAEIQQAARNAALDTVEVLATDLANSHTMPFDNGYLQGGGTYTTGVTVEGNQTVDFTEGDVIHVALTNDAPQARRLYYHPEYKFQRGKNNHAGALWLEPYISGEKKDFIRDKYAQLLQMRLNRNK